MGESNSSAVVTKSMTLEPRQGNDRPKYFENSFGSINSNGLENLGYKEYCELIPKLKKFGKPIIASCVGFNVQEFETIIKALDSAGADVIEANLSCPNIVGKPQVAYDFEASEKYLHAIRNSTQKPLWIKLPPYFEEVHRSEMAKILLHNNVDGITLINSVGNSLIVDVEKEQTVMKPKTGLGGLGGKYVKPIALANVWSFHNELKDKIPIVGVGGVYSGSDAFEFFLCGASLIQIASAFKNEGIGIFERIEKEFLQLMQKKKYHSIEQFRGKLKTVENEDYGFSA